jgi:hypothetical protein
MRYSKPSNNSATATIEHLLVMAFAILTIGCGEKKSDGVNVDELEMRNDITYLRGADTPFTGKYFILNKNGKRELEVNLKDGMQDGLATDWHLNGQKKSEGKWKNGQQEGFYTAWHENGQKEEVQNWKNGKAEGLVTSWHENGQKANEGIFKDGKLVSSRFWNSKGEEVDSYEELEQ